MRVATIGVGSNSVRMLVAEVKDGKIHTLLRDRAGTRLFASLNGKQELSNKSISPTIDAVEMQWLKAKTAGAGEITLFATSAVRDAQNKQLFCEQVFKRTGLKVDVLSGECEAALSYMGATEGKKIAGVIDIGGGSTEIVMGNNGKIIYSYSHQMGAVRLYNWKAIISAVDIIPAVEEAFQVMMQVSPPVDSNGREWIAVGGTATTLAAIVHCISWDENASVHGLKVNAVDMMRVANWLAPMTVEERVAVIGMRPQRADIVVNGICIMLACLRMLKINQITVSENGNLNGYIMHRYSHLFTENLHK